MNRVRAQCRETTARLEVEGEIRSYLTLLEYELANSRVDRKEKSLIRDMQRQEIRCSEMDGKVRLVQAPGTYASSGYYSEYLLIFLTFNDMSF